MHFHRRNHQGPAMKEIRAEIPDHMAQEIDALVRAGWFSSESELARLAVIDFVRRHRFELVARFQQEDIAWALRQREPSS